MKLIAEEDLKKFHLGLRRPLLEKYMLFTEQAAIQCLDSLPTEGTFDIFEQMKTVMHRVGFHCWVGPEAACEPYFSRLVEAFEVLDPESSFKNLGSLLGTLANGKRDERRAIRAMAEVLHEIWAARGMMLDNNTRPLITRGVFCCGIGQHEASYARVFLL